MNIGLVPMAAKPYHAGHHWLVEKAASENDKVLLYVSISDRKRKGEHPILGSDMQRVWKEEIEKVLPSNVTPVYGGSPVGKVIDVLVSAEEDIQKGPIKHDYRVYSDAQDTMQNYSHDLRMRYFPTIWKKGHVKFAGEEDPAGYTRGSGAPNVSGTALRSALNSCDLELFKKGMPAGVDAQKIYDTLCLKSNESVLRAYIGAIISG